MTLDYDTDYRFMLTISQALRSQGRYPSFEAVMEHLAAHPELTEINREAQSAYEAHLALSAGV
jgi:spore coat polysaccharide biosynthesis protein SpsF (cytidylyltransferase family)